MRKFLAILVCKLIRFVGSFVGRGSSLPGQIALKICPDILQRVQLPPEIIAVTGSNGKTSTSVMIAHVLTAAGRKVVFNREGSNQIEGVTTMLLCSSTLTGRCKSDAAVIESDERYAQYTFRYFQPTHYVITNLYRDQLTRNGHPQWVFKSIEPSIGPDCTLILNADDLISCTVAPENQRVYIGIDRLPTDVTECENLLNDMRICPRCAGKLRYEYRRYHHIGRAVCESCGFHSPDCDYLATKVDTAAHTMCIREAGQEYPYTLLPDSLHNIYNTVTVIAALRQLGYDHGTIARRMAEVKIPASRLSEEEIGGVKVIMQMSKDKNALACSRNFDYIRSKPGKKELLLMMNCLGVAKSWSENPSWMYDTDFEFLNSDDVTCLGCAGPRAYDYQLRLLLAGIPRQKIRLAEDEFAALELLPLTPGDDV